MLKLQSSDYKMKIFLFLSLVAIVSSLPDTKRNSMGDLKMLTENELKQTKDSSIDDSYGNTNEARIRSVKDKQISISPTKYLAKKLYILL